MDDRIFVQILSVQNLVLFHERVYLTVTQATPPCKMLKMLRKKKTVRCTSSTGTTPSTSSTITSCSENKIQQKGRGLPLADTQTVRYGRLYSRRRLGATLVPPLLAPPCSILERRSPNPYNCCHRYRYRYRANWAIPPMFRCLE